MAPVYCEPARGLHVNADTATSAKATSPNAAEWYYIGDDVLNSDRGHTGNIMHA